MDGFQVAIVAVCVVVFLITATLALPLIGGFFGIVFAVLSS